MQTLKFCLEMEISIMKTLKKVYNGWCRFEDILAGTMFAIIVLLTFINAVLRVFNHPIVTNDDIVLLLFGWTALMGADIAMRNCRLVGMDIIVTKFSPKVRKIFEIFVYLFIITMLVIFAKYGFALAFSNWDRSYKAIPISYGWVTLALPICSILMIVTASIKIGIVTSHFSDNTFNTKNDTVDIPIDEGDEDEQRAAITE